MLMLGLWLGLAGPALAQKPQGAFDAGCAGPAAYSAVADDDTNGIRAAVHCALTTGRKWVLLVGYGDPVGIPVNGPQLRQRMDQLGLTPHIVAIMYREEWYGQARRGELPVPQTIEGLDIVHAFGSAQQCALKAAFGKPILYVDGFVNSDKAFGYGWYQPLPLCTDLFGFEAYVERGRTWAGKIPPLFQYHRQVYPTLPLVIIGQGFRTYDPRDAWSEGPTAELVDKTLDLMADPGVVSIFWFTWQSRATMEGLDRKPQLVERIWKR